MKVVTRTGEYTIYKKRNQRYAVRNRQRQWVRGDDKVAVLLAHNLVTAPPSSAPDQPEEPAAEPTEAAEQASTDSSEAEEEKKSEG